jgi:hypothetical protein
MPITREKPNDTWSADRAWTVSLVSEVASVPGAIGDVVHVLETDAWLLWRPDGSWVPLGGGSSPHTHPTSEVTGLEAALAGKAATSHTHALESYVLLTPNALTYTNAPAGGLEVTTTGGTRAQLDLRAAVNVVGQVIFSVLPHATGVARFEYSINGGTNWLALLDMGTGGYTLNVPKISASTAVPAGAKIATCLVRLVITGDGAVDPVVQKAVLNFQSA